MSSNSITSAANPPHSEDASKPPPFELNDTDRAVLAQTDDEFHYYTWEELKEIIGTLPT